jgi:hypothetical protein
MNTPHSETGSAIVYAGKHYGREHAILAIAGNTLTVKHREGDRFEAHRCDCEILTSLAQTALSPSRGS